MTPAHWISDGSPVAFEPLKSPRPRREWRFRGLVLSQAPRQGRWSCQTEGDPSTEGTRLMAGTLPACGAAGYRTPVGALLATLRLVRRG